MCVVAETILISDFEGDMHYGLTLVTTAIARDVQKVFLVLPNVDAVLSLPP
jgi:hypothetical protein